MSADSYTNVPPATSLHAQLATKRDAGRKLLITYVTAGITPDWVEMIDAQIDAGADAVEVAIPFSDPAVDGPTVQQASVVALRSGITPRGTLDALRGHVFGAPLIAMTYYNIVFRYGLERFASDLAASGVGATILPDLPWEAAAAWIRAAGDHDVENVLMAAPVSSDERLRLLTSNTRGFIYTVSTMGTTGEREELDVAATVLAGRIRAVSDVPVCIGFGVSTPEHAVQAARSSDGVVVASALMRTVLDGGDIDDVAAQVSAMRVALDSVSTS